MNSIAYRLNERPHGAILALSTLQWFIFTLANVVTVPVVLGHAFGMNPHEIALYTERTFFVCGLIGIIQVLFGHRFPVIEGPAGMWWGVFLVLIQMTKDTGGSLVGLQQDLEMGLLIAACIYIVLAVFHLLQYIRNLFTPIVTGTFMILLSLQLSKSLLNGVLGIGFLGNNRVMPTVAILSLALICLTIGLMTRGKGLIKSLAVLISLLVGWVVYGIFGMVQYTKDPTLQVIQFPQLFPWGMPHFHIGIVITAALTAIILLSNIITSIQVIANASGESLNQSIFTKGTFASGIGTALAGCFGIVGAVPLSVAGSFVSLTGIASRLPFLLASIAVTLLGLFPKVGQLVGTLPAPVGYAVLFTVFGQLIGFGLLDFKRLHLDQRDLFVISLPLMSGVGIFFVSGQAWLGLPPLLGYILGNGLIVGVALVMILEHIVFKKAPQKLTNQS